VPERIGDTWGLERLDRSHTPPLPSNILVADVALALPECLPGANC
jgi:hypothetical protein